MFLSLNVVRKQIKNLVRKQTSWKKYSQNFSELSNNQFKDESALTKQSKLKRS